MGREVRRVPLSWQHPKNENGYFIPLHDKSYALLAMLWDEGAALWEQGFIERDGSLCPRPTDISSYEGWEGERPVECEYFPEWPTAERVGWQWYETVTEGTPLSPVCRSARDLACWMTWFGDDGDHSYEEWLEIIKSIQAIPSVYLEVPEIPSLTASSRCDGPPIIHDASLPGPRIPLFDEILGAFGLGRQAFLIPGISAQGGSVGPETHNHPWVPPDHCRHRVFRGMTGKDSQAVTPETHRYPRSQAPWAPIYGGHEQSPMLRMVRNMLTWCAQSPNQHPLPPPPRL